MWVVGAALGGAVCFVVDGRIDLRIGAVCGACFYASEQVGKSLLNRLFTITEKDNPVFCQRIKLCCDFTAAGTVMVSVGHSWMSGVGLGLGVLGVKSLVESCLKQNRTPLN